MTVTLDLPPHLANRVESDARAQGRSVPDFLLDTVSNVYEADTDTEPVDMALIAELRTADEETKRVGTVSFEDVLRQAEADRKSEAGLAAAVRARVQTRQNDPHKALV